jgi:hypothetical protein
MLVAGLVLGLAGAPCAWGQVQSRLPGDTLTINPGSGLTPVPPSSTPSGVSLGQPTFDPYATGAPPPSTGSVYGASAPPASSWPGGPPPTSTATPGATGLSLPPPPPAGVGQSPSSLFPNGFMTPSSTLNSDAVIAGMPVRLFQPRARASYIPELEDGTNDLGMNEFDTSVVATLPNFLHSGQPLLVIPSFSLVLLDGPVSPPADLPAQVYGAYLDAFWKTDPMQLWGVELGGRVGVFTSFDTVTSESIRTMGLAQLRLQLTPQLALKGGVAYIDRVQFDWLPTGGVIWHPNPKSRWDIYFPQPKIACYVNTMGNQDLWWYVGGEFGGGSWTVERLSGATQRVDINDIRVYTGFEWGPSDLFREGRRLGFVEVGWITNRRLVYDIGPPTELEIDDSLMVRAGVGY